MRNAFLTSCLYLAIQKLFLQSVYIQVTGGKLLGVGGGGCLMGATTAVI